jgi:hypothetical protein
MQLFRMLKQSRHISTYALNWTVLAPVGTPSCKSSAHCACEFSHYSGENHINQFATPVLDRCASREMPEGT